MKKLTIPLIFATSFSGFVHSTSFSGFAHSTYTGLANNYIKMGHAIYEDSYILAKQLRQKIKTFLEQPTEKNLTLAKEAWKKARIPYQQSEVFRFANEIVDDWEGKVNAWPLDEGAIDYVQQDNYLKTNPYSTLNLVSLNSIYHHGQTLNLDKVSPKTLAKLHMYHDEESNVTTGYHAIEFLLWGQDLNGNQYGAGERPATDYATDATCTHGHCDHRRNYLKAVTDLLVSDLKWMTLQWDFHQKFSYAQQLMDTKPSKVVLKMFKGAGMLATAELANERISSALETNSQEEEHDCFSDNTHWSHYYNVVGIQNLYNGTYTRIDGTVITGSGLLNIVKRKHPNHAETMKHSLQNAIAMMEKIVHKAEHEHQSFDQLIAANNTKGNRLLRDSVQKLKNLVKNNVRAVVKLNFDKDDLKGVPLPEKYLKD